MPKIELKGVSVTYLHKGGGQTEALKNLTITIPSSSFSVVLGPSGCGKSTMLRSIAGMNNFEGYIYSDGKDIEKIEVRKRNIAYVSQTFDLYPHLTVYDNLAFPLKELRMKPDEIDRKVVEMAKRMNILPCLTRKPRQISIGQQQRVSLGRSLIKEPTTVLFDEPLSNIDPVLREYLLKDIKEVCSQFGATVIYVTHDVKEAMLAGDNIIVIDQGRAVFEGTAESLSNSNIPLIQSLLSGSGIK